jgi:hypothetical protein
MRIPIRWQYVVKVYEIFNARRDEDGQHKKIQKQKFKEVYV